MILRDDTRLYIFFYLNVNLKMKMNIFMLCWIRIKKKCYVNDDVKFDLMLHAVQERTLIVINLLAKFINHKTVTEH